MDTRQKLNRPRAEEKMLSLIEQMREAAEPLIEYAATIKASSYTEDEIIAFVLQLRGDGVMDAIITAQRLN